MAESKKRSESINHALVQTNRCDLQGCLAIRNRSPLGPYSRLMPRALWWSWGGRRFLMSEVPLFCNPTLPSNFLSDRIQL